MDLSKLSYYYGKERLRFLQEEKPELYNQMVNDNTLYNHLLEIDEKCWEEEERLVEEFMRIEGVTNDLKAKNQMEWVGLVNNIKSRVRSIIQNDFIYV